MRAFSILIFTIIMTACSTSHFPSAGEVDFLRFKFHDSSVPPEFHRSYLLYFHDDEVRVVIDSYGDILAEETVKIGEDKVKEAFSLIGKFKIADKSSKSEGKGCTGGTGISVSYGKGETTLCDGYNYFCAGEESGSLQGDLKGFEDKLTDLIPNFGQIMLK